MHYEVELGIVVSGTLRCDYQKKSFTLGPGEVWFTGIWEPHRTYALKKPCTLALLLASPDMTPLLSPWRGGTRPWLTPFLAPIGKRPQAGARRRESLIGVAERIGQALEGSPEDLGAWLQLCLLEALLWVTEGQTRQPESVRAIAKPGDLTPAIKKAFQTTRFVTTTEGARACGLSRNAFSRRFHETFQMSFSNFALHHRLSGAADDLLHHDLPIKAVAAKWGFRDISHFHRTFIRHFECSPHAYRLQSRQTHNQE